MDTETVHLATVLAGNLSPDSGFGPARALGPPDDVWTTDGGATSWEQSWGFADPTRPRMSDDVQQVTVLARRAARGSATLQAWVRRNGQALTQTTVQVEGTTPVTLEWADPGGSSQGLTLELAATSGAGDPIGTGIGLDAATWTALVEGAPDPPASPWSVWEGGAEVPVTMSVWEGGAEVPVT